MKKAVANSASADVSAAKEFIYKFRLCFVIFALNRSLNDSRNLRFINSAFSRIKKWYPRPDSNR